jgi:hypothetical protein
VRRGAFPFAGQFGVPADATAVALNLTAVDATVPTYVSVWPGGTVKPFTANLNPVPGLAVPNLVIGQLGPGRQRSASTTTRAACTWWPTSWATSRRRAALRLAALTPSRLLDTRDGTGDVLGAGRRRRHRSTSRSPAAAVCRPTRRPWR